MVPHDASGPPCQVRRRPKPTIRTHSEDRRHEMEPDAQVRVGRETSGACTRATPPEPSDLPRSHWTAFISRSAFDDGEVGVDGHQRAREHDGARPGLALRPRRRRDRDTATPTMNGPCGSFARSGTSRPFDRLVTAREAGWCGGTGSRPSAGFGFGPCGSARRRLPRRGAEDLQRRGAGDDEVLVGQRAATSGWSIFGSGRRDDVGRIAQVHPLVDDRPLVVGDVEPREHAAEADVVAVRQHEQRAAAAEEGLEPRQLGRLQGRLRRDDDEHGDRGGDVLAQRSTSAASSPSEPSRAFHRPSPGSLGSISAIDGSPWPVRNPIGVRFPSRNRARVEVMASSPVKVETIEPPLGPAESRERSDDGEDRAVDRPALAAVLQDDRVARYDVQVGRCAWRGPRTRPRGARAGRGRPPRA